MDTESKIALKELYDCFGVQQKTLDSISRTLDTNLEHLKDIYGLINKLEDEVKGIKKKAGSNHGKD